MYPRPPIVLAIIMPVNVGSRLSAWNFGVEESQLPDFPFSLLPKTRSSPVSSG